jgi:hypothetical protein
MTAFAAVMASTTLTGMTPLGGRLGATLLDER